MIKNSKGTIFYGMHFYPGVAEYCDAGQEPYRILINENTIRRMSPSFAGRPIYVEHVDTVEQDPDALRAQADGYVIESFFNAADGKTWAKFLITSNRGLEAVERGMRLSNAYLPKSFGAGGHWNGVDYVKEVTEGEFEHLAIVSNPRYEESVIMTPEKFKAYNNEKEAELIRLANSKETPKMNFFKRAKVENSKDFEGMMVELPKSKKEVSLTDLVKNADELAVAAGQPRVAMGSDLVEYEGMKITLDELLQKMKALSAPPAAMNEDSDAGSDDSAMDNADDEAKKKAAELAEAKKDNDDDADKDGEEEEKKQNDEEELEKAKAKKNAADKAAAKKANFDAIKNAENTASEEMAVVELSSDRLARGRKNYGSN